MKTTKKYFTANWRAVKSDMADKNSRIEMRKQLKEISKRLDDEIHAQWKIEDNEKKTAAINAIKALPIGSIIFYKGGFGGIPFGSEAIKEKDGRTRATVRIDGKLWSIYYESLSIEPVTGAERMDNVVKNRIESLLINS